MFKRIVFLALLILPTFCGLSWAVDCRLRGFNGTEIVQFDCQDATTFAATPSKLRVRLNNTLHGISLVLPADAGASQFRVRLADGTIMALAGSGGITLTKCEEFQMISYHPSYPGNGNYQLGDNINCAATNSADSLYNGSLWQLGYAAKYPNGFNNIPNASDSDIAATLSPGNLGPMGFMPFYWGFSGTLDGKGHTISNLKIARSSWNWDAMGLFSRTSGARIKNVHLVNASVSGSVDSFCKTGGLVGSAVGGSIQNVTFQGTVSGYTSGGLVGNASNAIIEDSSVTVGSTVTGSISTGGLVGASHNGSSIVRSHASCTVNGSTNTGGLVGFNGWVSGGNPAETAGSSIADSYATGTVNGSSKVGGLVGYQRSCYNSACTTSMTNSYATGNVNGSGSEVGGLVGKNEYYATVSSSYYATGTVRGVNNVGGLVGVNANWAGISDSYARGPVIASGSEVGGLVGTQTSSAAHSYAAGAVTGAGKVGGLFGASNQSFVYCFSTGVAASTTVGDIPGGMVGNIQLPVSYGTALSYDFWSNETNTSWTWNADTFDPDYQCGRKITPLSAFYTTATGRVYHSYSGISNPLVWDFTNTWVEVPNDLPRLRWQQ